MLSIISLADVLVSPLRVVHRLTDLTDEETADLFNSAKTVQYALERAYNVTSSTVSVQDGPDAGQSVKVIISDSLSIFNSSYYLLQ